VLIMRDLASINLSGLYLGGRILKTTHSSVA
jgi:hypothetical protein